MTLCYGFDLLAKLKAGATTRGIVLRQAFPDSANRDPINLARLGKKDTTSRGYAMRSALDGRVMINDLLLIEITGF